MNRQLKIREVIALCAVVGIVGYFFGFRVGHRDIYIVFADDKWAGAIVGTKESCDDCSKTHEIVIRPKERPTDPGK